jgi:uncharacterized membrane protein YphA (DoxX/SURF4 family)
MINSSSASLAWNALRYAYGAVILLAGLDKIFGTHLIVEWSKYVSPFVANVLPVSIPTFLILMGIVEVVVAILLFTRWTVLASYLSVAWLLLISINLLMIGGYVDIAIRDILLAVGAFASAKLAEAHGYSLAGYSGRAERTHESRHAHA